MDRFRRSQTGFTLVEMLVVIGIIAVLVAILMPVIGSVQERSRQTQCSANLIQIGAALRVYRTDYGRYPFRPYYDTDAGMYLGGVSALYPDYISNASLLVCPNDASNLRGLPNVPGNYSTYNGLVAGFISGTSHSGGDYWKFALRSDMTQAAEATETATITYNYGGYSNSGWDQSVWDDTARRWVTTQDPQGGSAPSWLREEGKNWRHYPRLMNQRAPDNAIATRCRGHHKYYGRDETHADSTEWERHKWRDVILRLGSGVETVDYDPWRADVSGGASQWRIQK